MKKYQNLFLTEDEVRQLIEDYCEKNENQRDREKRNKKFRKHFQTNMLELKNTRG